MCQSLASSFKVTTERDLRRQGKLSCFQYNSGETEAQGVQWLCLRVHSGSALGARDIGQVVLELRRNLP